MNKYAILYILKNPNIIITRMKSKPMNPYHAPY